MTTGGSAALHRADLRDGDLPVGQHFQQVGLERLVGAVELVDQQHRRLAERLQRAQQRPADQEALREDVLLESLARLHAFGLGHPDLDHLPRVIPFVRGLRDVEALVALQADELAPERVRHHLADLGLAHAGLAFEEQRPFHGEREEERGREAAVGHVVALREQGLRFVDRLRHGFRHKAFIFGHLAGTCHCGSNRRRLAAGSHD